MRIDIIWNQVTTTVDLADGIATVGGGEEDGIRLDGLPVGLLTLRLVADQLSVTAQRSVRVGDAVFPARIARLLVAGEDLELPNDIVIRRVIDQKKRDSRRLVGTAFVAEELLKGDLHAEETRAATLTCVTGLDRGRVFPIPFADNVIGRADDVAVRIRDRAVSRYHVRLERDAKQYVLKLIASSMNGVYVNGLLLKKDTALKTGDVVEVGQTILRFDASERAPEEHTVVVAEDVKSLEPTPILVPHAAEPQRPYDPEPQRKPINLETWLMSAGVALTLLGIVAAALMLR